MRTIEFTVPGNPIPKQSFKVGKGGGYTPQRIKDWQETVAGYAMLAMRGLEKLSGNVVVHLYFNRNNRLRVDLDNLSKAVLDGMNEIVFEDDSQIVHLSLLKIYDKENPSVVVSAWEQGE